MRSRETLNLRFRRLTAISLTLPSYALWKLWSSLHSHSIRRPHIYRSYRKTCSLSHCTRLITHNNFLQQSFLRDRIVLKSSCLLWAMARLARRLETRTRSRWLTSRLQSSWRPRNLRGRSTSRPWMILRLLRFPNSLTPGQPKQGITGLTRRSTLNRISPSSVSRTTSSTWSSSSAKQRRREWGSHRQLALPQASITLS